MAFEKYMYWLLQDGDIKFDYLINFEQIKNELPDWQNTRANVLYSELKKIIDLSDTDPAIEIELKDKYMQYLEKIDPSVMEEILPVVRKIVKYSFICYLLDFHFKDILRDAYEQKDSSSDPEKYKKEFSELRTALSNKYGELRDQLDNRTYLPFKVCLGTSEISPEFRNTANYCEVRLKRKDFESTHAYLLQGFLGSKSYIDGAYDDALRHAKTAREGARAYATKAY